MILNKQLIAGPCSAETEYQVLKTAEGLRDAGIDYFRAGLWKPRTRPGCFEGVGDKGLPWLRRVRDEFGLKTGTEVAFREHVLACRDAGLDMVWIGARTTSNPFLVQELADALKGSEMAVYVKNPINPDAALWVGAVERLRNAGIDSIYAVHRGFSSYEKIKYRNAPGWQIVLDFKARCPDIPVICDPSHLAGSKAFVKEIARKALDFNLDGLMIECHCDPASALSDAGQQLTPDELKDMLSSLSVRSNAVDVSADAVLSSYRDRIDLIDDNILRILGERMEISRKLGEYKKENDIPVIQAGRWEDVVNSAIANAKKYGLHEDFVKSIFSIIHDASIEEQN